MTDGSPYTGGCQCGAVRFRAENVGRASICHCRMCQKAFGGFFGPLVTGLGVEWARRAPKYFASSNKARRGFCDECGTPLTYEHGDAIELAIGSFDNPALVAPVIQVNLTDKLPFVDSIPALPVREGAAQSEADARGAKIVSNQHPDHDTAEWLHKRDEQ